MKGELIMKEKRPQYLDGGIRDRDGYIGNPLFEEEMKDAELHPYVGKFDMLEIPASKTLKELKEELGIK